MILDGALAAWRTSPLAAKRAKGARPAAACKGYRGACPPVRDGLWFWHLVLGIRPRGGAGNAEELGRRANLR